MNPYLWLRELYTENVMSRYMSARLEDNDPHVYAVADAAYLAMVGTRALTGLRFFVATSLIDLPMHRWGKVAAVA